LKDIFTVLMVLEMGMLMLTAVVLQSKVPHLFCYQIIESNKRTRGTGREEEGIHFSLLGIAFGTIVVNGN
jgi:hypothetical protein